MENKLFYKGLKVKVANAEQKLYGSLLMEYKNAGFLYVVNIFDNGNIAISDNPNGGILINFNGDNLTPIYDEDILEILDNKEKELIKLSNEISDIRAFINDQCKYVSYISKNCSTCKNNVEFPPPHTCDICTSLVQEEEKNLLKKGNQ